MWIASPRTGWFWTSLTITGVGVAVVDLHVEHGAACASSVERSASVSTANGCGSTPPP